MSNSPTVVGEATDHVVRYLFDAPFVSDVEAGRKRRTIRRSDKGARPGMRIELLTADEPDRRRLLGTGVLVSVTPVRIERGRAEQAQVVIGTPGGAQSRLAGAAVELFAAEDGFASAAAMVEWFDRRYGMPFIGFLHEWGPRAIHGSSGVLGSSVHAARPVALSGDTGGP